MTLCNLADLIGFCKENADIDQLIFVTKSVSHRMPLLMNLFLFFCYARSKRKTIIFGSRIKKKHWKTPRDRKGLNRILDLWKKTLSIMSKYFETVDWKFGPNKIRNVIRIYRWQNDPSWLYLYNVDHRGKLSQHWKENN